MAVASSAVHLATCDLDVPADQLVLVREIVALANAGGGEILVGVDATGTKRGLPAELLAKLVPGDRLDDVVAGFTGGDRLGLVVGSQPVTGGSCPVVEIAVPGWLEPPIVLEQHGRYTGASGQEITAFTAGSVLVRRRGRTVPACRDDFRRWRHEATNQVRQEILQRLAMVIDAPAGSTVRLVAGNEVLDEPRFLLSRSAALFRQQPEQLLGSETLTYLWRHRSVLKIDTAAAELLIQSAMRKRATLYLWLMELRPHRQQIERYLRRALQMRDRDKSDAARSMLLLAALFLDDAGYRQIHQHLAASNYTHMREAAETLGDRAAAEAQLAIERTASVDGRPVSELPTERLVAVADELAGGSVVTAARRLPPIGLELLHRLSPPSTFR